VTQGQGGAQRRGRMGALLALSFATLGEGAVPVGDTCPAHLFVVERSKNKNIVAYDVKRTAAGELDASEPVIAYWLLNGEKDRREELNRVEKDKAYGVEATPGETAGTYFLVFKADRKRRLTVRIVNGCPVATTPIGGRDGILRRLFIQSKEGSALPKVEYVELFGENADKNEPLYEKFAPGK
jgi:Domain of unknown function (DUF4833)